VHSDDYQKAKQGLLAADLTGRIKWRLTGTDRVRYLNGQSTCDIKQLTSGKSTWGAVTSIKGKLEGDLRIAATPESLLIDTDPVLSESLFNRLSKYIIADDVELSDISQEWKLYHTIGETISLFDPPKEADLLVFKSNRFGLPGLDLWLPVNSPQSLPCAGNDIWEALRIENGIPLWAIDMDQTNLAPEMPFERLGALSYSKGCYIGQEVIARIKSIGHVNKRLCLLHSEKELSLNLPLPCLVQGKAVGTATSGSLSPALRGTCILATLARQHSTPGQQVEIDGSFFSVLSS
jgi:folate-binding protein YgfZ